ncbi:DnaT-like ssDNA-binding protein [Sneathiella sp.]|uniref:DnaT-like ssDNA-binding protein n=1 Tax=Sneathiella sp. TaxID=1964365 RepID=UPI002625DA38|nr:DnaT-like ssDNA-binding protein [Sneathiella sp.]MDF2367493.1 hypothetical protein [Sneathiella sp.]
MTLITETGSGVAGATTYVSLAEADSHFTALANDDWTSAPEGQREQALIRAALHIDSYLYPGMVLDWDQGLKWPRSSAYDRDGRAMTGIPHALRTAALELADIFLRDPAGLDERRIARQKIGPIEVSYEEGKKRMSFIFRLLQQIGARVADSQMIRG